MPKKRSVRKTSRHQSFKLTPHSHSSERVMLYVVVSFASGFVFGLMFANQAFAAVGLPVL